VKVNLDPNWSHWFDEFTITPQGDDKCLLTGYVADQAALYGLIAKIGGHGIPLLSVTRVESKERSSCK
jgi:hypothetical protein